MRIEIKVGNDEPIIYPIRESRLVIGSSGASQIVVEHKAGVSRKHLQIDAIDDRIYITDLGSTNGTYINDERLTPGKKVEFTSFFPVRLGLTVFISLLEEEEGPIQPRPRREDSTLPQLDKAIGARPKVQIPKNIRRTKKKKAAVSDSSRMFFTNFIIFSLVAIGIYVWSSEEKEKAVAETKVKAIQAPISAPIKKPQQPVLIADENIPSIEDFQLLFQDIKCVTTLEKKLCELIPESGQDSNGVIGTMGKIVVLQPEGPWYEATWEIFKPDITHRRFTLDQSQRTALLSIYFLDSLPSFNWKELDKDIYFAFYRKKDGRSVVSSIIGIKSDELSHLIAKIPNNLNRILKLHGNGELQKFMRYFKLIKSTEETKGVIWKVTPKTIESPIQKTTRPLAPEMERPVRP